jgi:hypothetical protein
MYTGGNKSEQIQELKKEINHIEELLTLHTLPLRLDWFGSYRRQHLEGYLRKKKRKLGRLEKQVRQ